MNADHLNAARFPGNCARKMICLITLMAMRLFYRSRVMGGEHLPLEGPALLIPNHVTWLDALLLTASSRRPIRFVLERRIYNTALLRSLFRLMGVIPVSSEDGKKGLLEFMKQARSALDQGHLVCIFAEGELTRTGMLREFRGGFERIVKGTDYPIIPVYIGGAWGSILSYAHGRLLSRLPSCSPYPMTVLFGRPLPSTSTVMQVRQAVMELSCDYFDSLKSCRQPLEQYFVRTARQNWDRKAIADSSGRALNYGRTLTESMALADELDKIFTRRGQQKYVGVLLLPSVDAVLTNLALMLMGRVPVNLDYTADEGFLSSAVQQCSITSIITSQASLETFPLLPRLESMILLEDILPSISSKRYLWTLLRARLLPVRALCSRKNFTADSVATVIFSPGSNGESKGGLLSHHNIMSSIEALRMVFRVSVADNICSTLPLFHSLGFTATLWFPLTSGFSTTYHSNSMDGKRVARMVREHKSTLLLATPTFLRTYLRRASREDFATLRLVVTGTAKLSNKLADSFEARFGVRPMEGYGATELAPVITLSVPDVVVGGVRQHGAKAGSVGHPIPGVAIRVVDPHSGAALKPGETGQILVRGPNVMLGYLGLPDQTAEAIRDGWYVTGDIGIMDDDGFIRITGRRGGVRGPR